jgi:hypothetical protein
MFNDVVEIKRFEAKAQVIIALVHLHGTRIRPCFTEAVLSAPLHASPSNSGRRERPTPRGSHISSQAEGALTCLHLGWIPLRNGTSDSLHGIARRHTTVPFWASQNSVDSAQKRLEFEGVILLDFSNLLGSRLGPRG